MKKTLRQYFDKDLPETFFVIGINYTKADAETRGLYSLSETTQQHLLLDTKKQTYNALSVLSTCNRTEVYGFAKDPEQLIQLLCTYTRGSTKVFHKMAYVYKGHEAVSHVFKVGTGLDSQILGDFEIISQLRNSFKRSKDLGLLNAYMERLINVVVQTSKRIKNETQISNGATSVSFAAVQYILARIPFVAQKNILLFGLGKIGRNTCENLVKHTRNKQITLINRSKPKAEALAGKFQLTVKDYAEIQSEIIQTDVLVVATGASNPTISKELLFLKKPLLILDLSIPKNVDSNVVENPLVSLVHLDELSKMTDQTLHNRKAELPLALAILEEAKDEFHEWAAHRKYAPFIRSFKEKLSEIKDGEIAFQRKKTEGFQEDHAALLADRLIHKLTTQVVNHLKTANGSAEQSLEIIQKMFELETQKD